MILLFVCVYLVVVSAHAAAKQAASTGPDQDDQTADALRGATQSLEVEAGEEVRNETKVVLLYRRTLWALF